MTKRLKSSQWTKVFESTDGEPYLHLEKANEAGICHCKCERALVAAPGQLDCPWCGCGWLFSCAECGKAFTYAKPVIMHTPLEKLVEMDMLGRGWDNDPEFFGSCTDAMREMLAEIEEGIEYVYLDGYFLPLDAEDFSLEGMHANHEITELPHAVELKSPGALSAALGEPDYWEERRRDDDEEQEEDE